MGSGRKGTPGRNGKHGRRGKKGKNGKDGKAGKKGPPGPNGKKGPKGDSCKSELQVHPNALKSYVDMKFDVLKGMMDKTMTRTASGGVVEDTSEKMSTATKELTDTMTKLDPVSRISVSGGN